MELNRLEVAQASVRDSIASVIAHLQQIAQAPHAIHDHIEQDRTVREQCALLISIGGIGEKTAAALRLAEPGDARHFNDAGALTAFAGLSPRLQESGTYSDHVRISPLDSPRLRAGLYMPALTALTHNRAIGALKQRLTSHGNTGNTGNTGKHIVCAAMRKRLCIAYGVLKSGQPLDQNGPLHVEGEDGICARGAP